MRTFSYGGGVQSTAVLVLTAQNKLQYDAFLFANVGNDSENPKTIEYVQSVAVPFAEQHGLKLIELSKLHDGKPESLLGMMQRRPRSLPIPVYMSNGAPGHRTCTADFKIAVIARWQKQNGATAKNIAVTGLGISLDEFTRARTDSGVAWQALEYPLIDMRLTRLDCVKIIESAGLPVPPKSSCYFCPFHSRNEWIRIKREEPELFERAIEVENMINRNRAEIGKDKIYLHSSATPLTQAVADQMPLFVDTDDICDSGYCFV